MCVFCDVINFVCVCYNYYKSEFNFIVGECLYYNILELYICEMLLIWLIWFYILNLICYDVWCIVRNFSCYL